MNAPMKDIVPKVPKQPTNKNPSLNGLSGNVMFNNVDPANNLFPGLAGNVMVNANGGSPTVNPFSGNNDTEPSVDLNALIRRAQNGEDVSPYLTDAGYNPKYPANQSNPVGSLTDTTQGASAQEFRYGNHNTDYDDYIYNLLNKGFKYATNPLSSNELAKYYGINNDYSKILKLFDEATKSKYDALAIEDKANENKLDRNIATMGDQARQEIKKQYNQNIATGASQGMQYAAGIAGLLGLQDKTAEAVTEQAKERSSRSLQYAQELADNQVNAEKTVADRNNLLSQLSNNLFATDVQRQVGWNSPFAQVYSGLAYGKHQGEDASGITAQSNYDVAEMNDITRRGELGGYITDPVTGERIRTVGGQNADINQQNADNEWKSNLLNQAMQLANNYGIAPEIIQELLNVATEEVEQAWKNRSASVGGTYGGGSYTGGYYTGGSSSRGSYTGGSYTSGGGGGGSNPSYMDNAEDAIQTAKDYMNRAQAEFNKGASEYVIRQWMAWAGVTDKSMQDAYLKQWSDKRTAKNNEWKKDTRAVNNYEAAKNNDWKKDTRAVNNYEAAVSVNPRYTVYGRTKYSRNK